MDLPNKNLQSESVPLLASHDTALQCILGLLPQASPLESAMISWRFDGRVLAAYGSGVLDLIPTGNGLRPS